MVDTAAKPVWSEDETQNASFDFGLLAADIGVGFAVFDNDFRLISINESYRKIHGLSESETAVGTPMRDIAAIVLMAQGVSADEAAKIFNDVIAKLEKTGSYEVEVETFSERLVRVCRYKKPSGLIVETAEDLTPHGFEDSRSKDVAQIAALGRTRLNFALDAMADGFGVFDQQERLVAFNQKFVESYEAEAAHLIVAGKPLEEILREGIEAGIFNPEGKTPDAFVADRLEQHRNPVGSVIFHLKDGRYIHRQNRPTEDGCVVTIRADITELRNQQMQNEQLGVDLETKDEQLSEALSNMVQGLAMYDAEHHLIVCNNQYIEMIGLDDTIVKPGVPRREILRKVIEVAGYEPSKAEATLERFNEKDFLSVRNSYMYHFSDGRVIEIKCEPLANGGTVVTSEDITQREQDAVQLARYTKSLERSNAELQDFAYVASHDLQEPLRKIEAFGDRLSTKYGATLPDDGKLYLDRMQNAATRMRQLISDLLSYSRVTSEGEPFDRIDLNVVLEGVLSDIQIRLEESEGRVDISGLESIDADASQMRQLFQNLISNGLKFVKEGVKPVISITGEKLWQEMSSGPPKGIFKISVADNGIGFDPSYKDQIFAIFKRLHGRTEYEGTGIGLSTCRKIVERHQGTIDAEGAVGRGATFIIELPIEQKHKSDI